MKRLFTILFSLTLCNVAASAQFTRFENIKPMISTREDVEKLLGKGERDDWAGETTYYYENETVDIIYSDENCREGWFAPKDIVIEVYINFKEDRKLSELTKKVKLDRLRIKYSYDTADKMYHDDKKGVRFYANTQEKTWSSITYYPSARYFQSRCEN